MSSCSTRSSGCTSSSSRSTRARRSGGQLLPPFNSPASVECHKSLSAAAADCHRSSQHALGAPQTDRLNSHRQFVLRLLTRSELAAVRPATCAQIQDCQLVSPCRRQMESAKLMVEAKLQETGQQLMECERQLITATARRAAGGTLIDVESLTINDFILFNFCCLRCMARAVAPSSIGRKHPDSVCRAPPAERPKDVTNGGASAFASDSPRDDEDDGAAPLPESPGTPPSSARRAGHPFFNSLLENEVLDQCSTCSCPGGTLVCVHAPCLDSNRVICVKPLSLHSFRRFPNGYTPCAPCPKP